MGEEGKGGERISATSIFAVHNALTILYEEYWNVVPNCITVSKQST